MSERRRELRRRRRRKVSVGKIKQRAAKANASEKAILVAKLQRLTPGADTIIESLDLGKAR